MRGILLVLTAATAAPGGTIIGTVAARGASVHSESAREGAHDTSAGKIDYDRLRDFVVWIDQPVVDEAAPAVKDDRVVQRNVAFAPHVLPVAVGTTVLWPNEDEVFHNVFSKSAAKEFDLGLYTKDKVPRIAFDQVGRVDVFCSIHQKMHCIVLVLPNRYFAKTGADGRYAIVDVPAGRYQLRAWHERLPSEVTEVVVPAQGEVKVDFALGSGDRAIH